MENKTKRIDYALILIFIIYVICSISVNWDLFHENKINPARAGLNATIATVESIVERGTFSINESEFVITYDKMKVGDKFYSDKAPGFSIILSSFYYFLYHIGIKIEESKFLAISLLTIFGVSIPAIFCLYFYEQILKILFPKANVSKIMMCRNILGLGTILLSFSGFLNYHIMAGLLLILAVFYLLVNETKREKSSNGLVIGLSLGILFSMDLPTGGIFLFVVCTYLLIKKKYKLLFLVILSAAIPVSIYEFINYSITGKMLPPFFYRDEFYQFEGSTHTASSLTGEKGTDSFFNAKRFFLIYRNFFGSVGLFSLSPVLVLAVIGLYKLYRSEMNIIQLIKTIDLKIMLIIGVFFQIMFYNFIVPSATGSVYGVRHLIPIIPFLMIGFMLYLQYFNINKISVVIIIISIIFSFGGALHQRASERHVWGIRQIIPAYSFFHYLKFFNNYGN